MTCVKFDCGELATHLLLVRAAGGHVIHAIARCEDCGRADVGARLWERAQYGARATLIRIPRRLLAEEAGS